MRLLAAPEFLSEAANKRIVPADRITQDQISGSGTTMVLCAMPPKLRQLMQDLMAAGFNDRGGKGSHRNFRHRRGVNITLSGKSGDDAKQYQIRDVQRAIELVTNEKAK